jgi:class 3 adenylate cyclase
MDRIQTPIATPTEQRPPGLLSLDRFRLRFRDRALEAKFRTYRFHLNLGNVRFAFIAGICLWIFWGVLMRPYILALADLRLDLTMRFGIFIPILVLGLALTFTPLFARMWEWASVAIAISTLLLWVYYLSHILTLPAEYGYVGVILITAFTYTLLRLRFYQVMLITAVGMAAYFPYAFTANYIAPVSRALSVLWLLSFALLGGLSAYRTERFTRVLFLRERQLDEERLRSDGLLLNILPQAIVDELKRSPGERIAEAFDEVSVVFIDAVGSTAQAARAAPEDFAATLDELFRRFDRLADRHGLERIKTIGDAYMAVAGAPVPIGDHAGASVGMALDVLAEAQEVRWPSGDTVAVRVGVATGPAAAGVIGDRKFAYDLWGDAVNLASRLEENGEPGQVLVAESTIRQVADRYEFGPQRMMELKGKGLTPVRALLGRRSNVPITVPTP